MKTEKIQTQTAVEKNTAPTKNTSVLEWVESAARLCKPDSIYWCDGSEAERKELFAKALPMGIFEELNQEKWPGCYLHRSASNDVARTEHLTFVCTPAKEEAGANNNWMAPNEAYTKLAAIFDGSMRGRVMYVIPFVMGSLGSSFSKVGVEITDSLYVVLSMRIMTRMGSIAWKQLGDSNDWTRGLHCTADLDEHKRFICHFPQDNTIWSVGSGYGGNALLGKKCLSLRIGSYLGYREGWLAEHMVVLGIEDPEGRVTYVTAAFPSACGKTNLAMIKPPAGFEGYKVWTLGDDIAWLRPGPDGRLWAVNPEAGFFGVAPMTSMKSNPNAMATIRKNSLFTNVVKCLDGSVWWEGMDGEPPKEGIDWQGKPWTPAMQTKGAHPNSRFTAPASQCPTISPKWEDPQGVPISAMIFGGRRAKLTPLVYQTRSWQNGVYAAATMASETTAAQSGQVGVVRRDPMAMLPFCGYDMALYFRHWLDMAKRVAHPPQIFQVNWFATGDDGKFLWPGFGENFRVLLWIVERCNGGGGAVETPVGFVPVPDALDVRGLNLAPDTMKTLLSVDKAMWRAELEDQKKFLDQFGGRLPRELREEEETLRRRLHG